MRFIHVLVALLAVGLVGLMATAPGCAQSPAITLSVTPTAVALGPAETAQVVVVARIPEADLESIALSAFSDIAVTVQIADPVRSQPPLQGDQVWEATLTQSGKGQPAGKVYLRADYQLRESDGRLLPGVALASVDVQERVPDPIDGVIAAKLETTLDTLQDRQTRQVFVVVSNTSGVPVTVTHIAAWPIPNVATTTEELGEGARLESQQTHPFTLTLTAGDRVQPGKHLLVVRVDVEWERGGRPMAGSLVLNQQFEASAFGESAILQVLGIPSLLFLPGFLLVITLVLLVRWAWKVKLLGLELDFKKPEFLYIAVTVSLVVILLYPWLTGPLRSRLLGRSMASRNLLEGYGFDDIVLLWLGAVVTGFLFWAVGSCIYLLVRAVRKLLADRRAERERQEKAELAERERQERARLVPTEADRPLVILKKLEANGRWLDLKARKYVKDHQEQTVFQLPCPPSFAEGGKIWVAPEMLPWYQDDAAVAELSKLAAEKQGFGKLIAKLEVFENAGTVRLDWEGGGPLVSGPTLVDEGEVTEGKGAGSVFWPL